MFLCSPFFFPESINMNNENNKSISFFICNQHSKSKYICRCFQVQWHLAYAIYIILSFVHSFIGTLWQDVKFSWSNDMKFSGENNRMRSSERIEFHWIFLNEYCYRIARKVSMPLQKINLFYCAVDCRWRPLSRICILACICLSRVT